MATNNSNLRNIPLSEIRENPIALREVNRTDESFQGLVDSIKEVGVLNAINVRQMADEETGKKYYVIIDGLHRYTASVDAGREDIPAQIVQADDAKVLELQLIANAQKVETRPVEYSKQLTRILGNDPTLTSAELAKRLGMSPAWIGQRLGLVKLDDKIGKIVDEGNVNLSNALMLAKLPVEEQQNYLDRAMTESPAVFTPTVNARVKEIRDAKREGRAATPAEFVPVAHLRKMTELKGELDHPEQVAAIVRSENLRSPEDIVKATLKWALHLDQSSVEAAKSKDDARKAANEKAKADRKADREKKAQEAAANKTAEVAVTA